MQNQLQEDISTGFKFFAETKQHYGSEGPQAADYKPGTGAVNGIEAVAGKDHQEKAGQHQVAQKPHQCEPPGQSLR